MELYPYQEEGAGWLARRKRALLADEQGLGKTIQAVAACDLVGARRVLVLCPAVARPVWADEFEQWSLSSPELRVYSYDELVVNAEKRVAAQAFRADTLILDEAHYLKTPTAKRTRLAYSRALATERIWSLTGTPMPNHPGELWTHASVLGGAEQDYEEWVHQYCLTAPSDYADFRVVGARKERMPELRQELAGWVLRRTTRVLDLPALRWGTLPLEGSTEGVEDPTMVAKLRIVLEREPEAIEKAFRHTAVLRRAVGLAKVPGALAAVRHRLEEQPGKAIVFAWHREVLDALYRGLSGFNPVMFNGSIGRDLRRTYVEAFQNADDVRVFIGQIQAAGTAITLTAADWVLFVESDWSPASMAQAAKRAHRIGQARPVLVQAAILPGTMDAAIQRVLTRKARDITQVLEQQP